MAENKDSKQKITIEIGLNTDQYALLDKKARQFSKDGENISVENLVKLLVVKSGLELDLLESTTLTELKKEVRNLYLLKAVYENSANKEKILRIESKISHILNRENLTDEEQFEKLKKDLEDYFSDKQLLLDIVGNIRQMNESCHIENNGSLILFEDYIKKI